MKTTDPKAGVAPVAVWKMHRIRRSIGNLRLRLPRLGVLLLPLN